MFKSLVALILIAFVAACGGGGGSAGTPSSGSGSVPVITVTPPSTLQIGLFDGNNAAATSITQGNNNYLLARLRDGAGTAVAGKVVTFRVANASLVALFPADGTALTDASGFAKVAITPVPANGGGATTVNATAINGTETVASELSFSVSPAPAAPQPKILISVFNSRNQQVTRVSQENGHYALAQVLDGSGLPVPNRLVVFAAANQALMTLAPVDGTTLTDSAGNARVSVFAPSNTVGGATSLSVRANLANGGSVSNLLDIAVDAAPVTAVVSPALQLTLRNGAGAQVNTISQTGNNTLNARLVDGNGAAVVNKLVQFSVSNGALASLFPSDGSALTDSFGEARVSISPAAGTLGGATGVSARAFVGAFGAVGQLDAAVAAVSTSAAPTLLAGIRDATDAGVTFIRAGNGNNAFALVRDANGAGAVGRRVVFSLGGSTLAKLVPPDGSALTDGNGFARIGIDPSDVTQSGAATMTVDSQVGNVAVQSKVDFEVRASATSIPQASMKLVLASPSGQPTSSIGPVAGHYATVQVLDAAGFPVAGRLVAFALGNPLLATLSPADGSALSNAAGYASVFVTAVPGTLGGATVLSANSSLGSGSLLTSQLGVSVLAAPVGGLGQPTLRLTLLNAAGASVNSVVGGAGNYLNVLLRDAQGAPVANRLVQFSVDNANLIGLTPAIGTALTDADGNARVNVAPTAGNAGGATSLRAAASVGTVNLTGQLDASVVALASTAATSIQVGLRNAANAATSSISTGGGNYLFAILSGANGVAVAGRRVVFSLTGAPIATLNPADGSALTDSAGFARVGVEPNSSAVSGAISMRADAAVGSGIVSASTDFAVVATAVSAGQASLRVGVFNASNAAVNNVSVGAGNYATATVLDANGAVVVGKKVIFSTIGSPVVTLNPADGSALTDASGVARIQISPVSLASAGALTLRAAATVGVLDVTGQADFSVSASAVTLGPITVATTNVTSGGNLPVNIVASLATTGAPASSINIAWAASCGTVDPVVLTNGSGVAGATYSAVQANGSLCSGDVTISASTSGATPATRLVTVAPPQANTINFTGANPAQIFLKGSGATEQSFVSFTVLAGNVPLPNVAVEFSLTTNPGGVSLGVSGSLANVTATSNSSGVVSIPVFAGAIPGAVEVRAALVSNPAVFSLSRNLTVASGPPSQRYFSLAVQTFNIEGAVVDGTNDTLTVRVADRQGNAVPDGTVINFTSEGGQIGRSCATSSISGISACSVGFVSQNPRPPGGRVSILAFAEGVKDFVDTNGNNAFDAGDTLINIGDAYRDDNENGFHDVGEFVVPRGGTIGCSSVGQPFPSKADTCTSVAGVATTVRQQTIVLFSSSQATFYDGGTTRSSVRALIGSRIYGGDATTANLPMPAGSVVTAVGTGLTCSVQNVTPSTVPNVSPGVVAGADLRTAHGVSMTGCALGDSVIVTVTSPGGVVTSASYVLP